MKEFEVIETNGGNLILFVFGKDRQVEYAFSGYEFMERGSLLGDLKAIRDGADPANDGWEIDREIDDPQGIYDSIQECEFPGGYDVVADNNGIYPDCMGYAAAMEFGIEIDD